MLRGARVVELRLGAPAEAGSTWIRQEDGSRVVQGPSDPRAKQAKAERCCLPAPRVSDLVDLLRVEVLGPLAAAGALGGEGAPESCFPKQERCSLARPPS